MLIPFERYPRERALIGEMLLAYGELEVAMLGVLASVMGTAETAVRTLYQLRSESHRINVFEAVVTPWFVKVGLAGQLREAVAAMHHCKRIRNQYAHCTFIGDAAILRFAELDSVAEKKKDDALIVFKPLTLALIERQRGYFDYVDHLLLWLNQTYRLKTDQPILSDQSILKPRRIQPPKTNSHGETLIR